MHTIDSLTTQLHEDLPDLKTEAKGDHIGATFRSEETAKIYITEDHYVIEQSDLLGRPTQDICRTYAILRGRLGGQNILRSAFSYDEPIRTFLAEVNGQMEEIGWRFEGPNGVDGCVGGWMPEDYDARNPGRGLTDLAVIRAEVSEDGEVAKISLVATGGGYQPYDETTIEGGDLVKWCVDWFKDRIWWYTDEYQP